MRICFCGVDLFAKPECQHQHSGYIGSKYSAWKQLHSDSTSWQWVCRCVKAENCNIQHVCLHDTVSQCPQQRAISANEQSARWGVTKGIVMGATQWTTDAVRERGREREREREREWEGGREGERETGTQFHTDERTLAQWDGLLCRTHIHTAGSGLWFLFPSSAGTFHLSLCMCVLISCSASTVGIYGIWLQYARCHTLRNTL